MSALVLILAACGTSQTGTGVPGSTEQLGTQAPGSNESLGTQMPSSTESLGTQVPSSTESTGTQAPSTTEAATTAGPETTMPATTEESTPATTEAVQATQPMTGTAVIPPTGLVDSGRVSNLMDFSVWDKTNNQIGNVSDLILNPQTGQVDYVVVTAGDKLIPVPWKALTVVNAQAQAASSNSSGPQNGFVLTVDQSTLENAPSFTTNNFPVTQTPDWDAQIKAYWQQYISSSQ